MSGEAKSILFFFDSTRFLRKRVIQAESKFIEEQTEITELRKRSKESENHRVVGFADLRLRFTKPDLVRSYLLPPFALVPSLSLSLPYLLLLVRRVSSFLVTSNGEMYTDVLAPETRRRDVSTMLNPDLGALCTAPFIWISLSFLSFFLRHRCSASSITKGLVKEKSIT